MLAKVINKTMRTTQKVRCPNCGSYAERHHITKHQLIQTECQHCDYLLVNCPQTGKVIEAYAPGLSRKPS